MRRRAHHPAGFAAAVSLALGAAAPAGAQQQVVDGNALDANQAVGSGGINPAAPTIDFHARNNLITGNTTDFGRFRGDVPYTAVGEFGGHVGSDDTFRFRANTLITSAPFLRQGRMHVGSIGGQQSVYRAFSSTNVGQRTFHNQQTTSIVPRTADFAVFSPATSGFLGDEALGDEETSTIGRFQGADGEALRVTASPLTGLRLSPLNRGAREPGDLADPRVPGAGGDPRRDSRPEADSRPRAGVTDPRQQARVDPSVMDLDNRVPDARLGQAPMQGSLYGGQSGLYQPTLALGQQLQLELVSGQLSGQFGQRSWSAAADRIRRLEAAIFEDPTNRAAADPGADVYQDVLAALRERRDPGSTQRRERDALPRDRFGGEERDASDESPRDPLALPGIETPELELPAPSDEQVEQAEEASNRSLAEAFGLQDPLRELRDLARVRGSAAGGGDVDQRPDPDQEPEAYARWEAQQALIDLMDRLDYDIARLDTLAGSRDDRINRLMHDAEGLMAQSKFLAAEAQYRQAVAENPAAALPRAGLVHAQLAAGMIRSAALNLRQLFERHPELIALRYNPNLLPPESRLMWLQNELQRTISRQGYASEPGLMMAYLGYQFDSTQLVRYGLAVAESAAPRDPLMPVLRRIWLGGEAEPQDGPEPAAGPGGEGAASGGGAPATQSP